MSLVTPFLRANLHTPKWVALVCLLLLPGPRGAAQFVEIAAEIEMMGWSGEETNSPTGAKPQKFSLVCTTGTNGWRIESDLSPNAEAKWLFDGTNVYHSLRITKPTSTEKTMKIGQTRLATVPFEQSKSNLTLHIWPSRDGLPLADYGVNLPWLAFCSGTYLKREGRLIPLPAANLRHTRDRFGYTDKTMTFQDEAGLPRTVDLFTSRSLLEASENDFDQEYFFGDRYAEWKEKILSNLKEGVQVFHYAATETTNFLGRTFPTKFEFFQMGRKYEQNGDWFCRGTGQLKSIRSSVKPDGLFVPSLQQTIVDWRFRDATARVNGLTYTSTNTFAAPTNDPALQQKFASRVETSARRRAK